MHIKAKNGALLNYEMGANLYKCAESSEIEALRQYWQGDTRAAYSYADAGFAGVSTDPLLSSWGVLNGEMILTQSLAGISPLGEGLYLLETPMGNIEFTVKEEAPAPKPDACPVKTGAGICVAPHDLSYRAGKDYSTLVDPFSAGGCVQAGDRIYWIVSDVGLYFVDDARIDNMIVSAPVDDLLDVCIVYGPVSCYLQDVVDTGDGLLFTEKCLMHDADKDNGHDGVKLVKIGYDGSGKTVLARQDKWIYHMAAAGDELYFSDQSAIYASDLQKGGMRSVFESQGYLADPFEYVGGQLLVSVSGHDSLENTGVYLVDPATGRAEKQRAESEMFLAVHEGRIYTDADFEKLYSERAWQVLPGGVCARFVKENSSSERVFAFFPWDGGTQTILPGWTFELGGVLYVQDRHGNLSHVQM